METKFQNIFIFHQHINIQRYQVSKEKTILRSYLKDKKKKILHSQVTRAVFVMVARDPLNQGSALVNPLVPETAEEKRIFQAGEINKLHRKVIQQESLFRVPPNETGMAPM